MRKQVMPQVDYNAVIDRPAETVWRVLKQFGQISQWHPAILESIIEDGQPDGFVGCVRRLTLQGGAVLRERLLMVDERHLSFSYRFEEAPLLVDNYVATVKLIPLSSESRTVVQWMAAFDTREPDPQGEQVADIRALIVGGHNSLQQFLSDGKIA
ncbi:SRPBCC family protein [Pectobacterium odoriferum]|uniref:SRPBCC family protein n=1 Tax=Pectobacterium odoriferum TaxID=78398 RepID=UPI001C63FEF8|nr:SRPBCC family protein [Pectobacterium odoriferum]